MQVIILLLTGFALIMIWFGLPMMLRAFQTRQLHQACVARRAIALTYDDGPSADVTPQLSALLGGRDTPATFFVIGREIDKRGDVVDELRRQGHDVGNHTQSHINAWKAGPLAAARDMTGCQRKFSRADAVPGLFRPPFGKATVATVLQAIAMRLRFVYWTVDTQDSWNRRAIDSVIDELSTRGGGVVLMHDFSAPRRGPTPSRHKEYVLDLTAAIIDFARQNDFQLVRVRDLLV
ncbi:polysaccharide deacetylase family protein [Spiribacter vilamensis]|uniref:Peptidoglycan/xylan/chitin deacetylase (PgdA/CDA1 family) n=1 Tax=Spiribacter vilamensis TaxID=531306 RepID=A0A4Q8CZG3_9GAMM|nr:polysaccharide deacetylase family protein [Spiribacter vilamensis]RZU98362.1 peptidoglycan/xylan/chitin deacetylase (PgdA/CDA1 family) [Spiribacter vilamensis]TVO60755.1 polysaccharide deacetylase family protein [Spiribacter vilamensis]